MPYANLKALVQRYMNHILNPSEIVAKDENYLPRIIYSSNIMDQWTDTEGARDNDRYPLLRTVHSKHTTRLNSEPGDRILDLGCGRNPIKPDVSVNIVGIDPDRQLVQQARRKMLDANFSAAVGNNLPFVDNSFDAVFMRGIVHHLDQNQRRATFAEISRILRMNGQLVVLEPDPDSWYRQFVWAAAAKLGYEHEESPHINDDGYANPKEIRQLCENAGLVVTEQSHTGSLLSPLAFLYPLSFGIGPLVALYDVLPANWWTSIRATVQ
jgi:SAM-dependent methyltransferase